MASLAAQADISTMRDPYEVLGVDKGATEDQIKAAYKKCALKYHPDKNRGDKAEEAADRFKEVVTAYNIVSDPDKRRRYDAGGFANLEASELSMELDLSSIGPMNTMFVAMFARLGVPIKTAVAQAVLDVAAEGSFSVTRLEFGLPVKGKVDKQEAVFFELEVTAQQIEEGFYVFAHSPIGSKFKLLLFDKSQAGGLQLHLQEDSSKTGKTWTTAGLFFLAFETYSLGPKVNPMDVADDPESSLFRRLESYRPRESCALAPGVHTFAVYGDNWFKRGQYQIEAVRAQRPGTWGNALALRDLEAQINTRKEDLKKFEKDYRRIQSEYIEACEKFTAHAQELEGMLHEREEAYLRLIDAEQAGASGGSVSMSLGSRSLWGSNNNGGTSETANGHDVPTEEEKTRKDKSPLFRFFSAKGKK